MDLLGAIVVCGGLIAFGLVSRKVEGTIVTAPLVFILFGLAVGPGGLGIARIEPGHGVIHLIAELTLVLVLFSDAARIDLKLLRRDHNLPVRMLLIGLPLTVLLGAGVTLLLFPAFSLWEAALLAAVLAPTDAALGQAVVSARAVPVRIRQALNVESGLNDGIALPAVLLFAALASAAAGAESGGRDWIAFGLLQVTLGPLAGIVLGYAGARLVDGAATAGFMTESFQGIGILAMAFLAFAGAEMVGGNGFIAAFVAGLVFGNTIRHRCSFLLDFMETEGQLLMLVTFLVFGAAMLPEGLHGLDWHIVAYAVLSLTLIRMIPAALSLIGTGVRFPTVWFLGWFGPRGLASILFALLIVERSGIPHAHEILVATIVTVGLSALLHGVSAAPLADAYGRLAARLGECEESRPVGEMPLRTAGGTRAAKAPAE
ncbi:MAG: sodium:proton antiporter [Inquilinus sp.]|nr:sodium:proton antiporter [Inquilinus sp.]